MFCQPITVIKHTSDAAPDPTSLKLIRRRATGEKKKTYTGTRLHRVAQVTAEVSGLVLCLVAAGQLGQALNNNNNNDKLVKPQL